MAFPHRLALGLVAALFLVSACAELGWNPLDPKEWEAKPPHDPGFAVAWPARALSGAPPVHAMRAGRDGAPGWLDMRWPAPAPGGARAGVAVFQRLDDAARAAILADPLADRALWPDLAIRAVDAGPLYRLDARGGERFWRRAVAGTEVCVVAAFLPAAAPEGLARAFFCRSAGDGLSEAAAADLVAAVTISGRS